MDSLKTINLALRLGREVDFISNKIDLFKDKTVDAHLQSLLDDKKVNIQFGCQLRSID